MDLRTKTMIETATQMVTGYATGTIEHTKVEGHYNVYIVHLPHMYAGLDTEQIARNIKSYVKRYIRIKVVID